MIHRRRFRAKCRCGKTLTFNQGPYGFKTICPDCQAVVRLKAPPVRSDSGTIYNVPDSKILVSCSCGEVFGTTFQNLGRRVPCPQCGRAHLVRAALESIAHGTAELLRAMEADSGVSTAELRVDGGAALNNWLMQFQADVLNVSVRRPALVETTAMGAAGLAGVATGLWPSGSDFLAVQGEGRRFAPSMNAETRTLLASEWARAVRAAVSWARDRE